ncbi:unnamed protein product, partial [marine sediment metagenome]
MFTGIVEEVGIVTAVQPGRLTISATEVVKGTKLGDSIAVNGTCLTVANIGDNSFSVDIMLETLRRTNLGALLLGQGNQDKNQHPHGYLDLAQRPTCFRTNVLCQSFLRRGRGWLGDGLSKFITSRFGRIRSPFGSRRQHYLVLWNNLQ